VVQTWPSARSLCSSSSSNVYYVTVIAHLLTLVISPRGAGAYDNTSANVLLLVVSSALHVIHVPSTPSIRHHKLHLQRFSANAAYFSSLVKGQIPLRYLVADSRFEAGRRPAASWNLAYQLASSELARASRSATCPRPASDLSATSFELPRHVEIARTCSKLVVDRFQPKFHYAMVADRFEAGCGPVADLLARASSLLAS